VEAEPLDRPGDLLLGGLAQPGQLSQALGFERRLEPSRFSTPSSRRIIVSVFGPRPGMRVNSSKAGGYFARSRSSLSTRPVATNSRILSAVEPPTPLMAVNSDFDSLVTSTPAPSRAPRAFSYARTLNDCGLPSSRVVSRESSESISRTSRVVTGRAYPATLSLDPGICHDSAVAARTDRTRDDQKAPPPGWRVEGMPDGEKGEDDKPDSPLRQMPGGRNFWILALILLAINFFVTNLLLGPEERVRIPYTFFVQQLDEGNVASITSTGDTIQGTFDSEVADPEDETDEPATFTLFETERPTFAEDDLFQRLQDNDVVVNAEPADAPAPIWQQIVFGFGPTLLLLYIFYRIFRRAGSAMGGLGGLGSSRAKRYEASEQRTTFDDVAGIEDAEDELVEIVDFLRNPDKYTRLGGTIPRGVLLTGLPGTGKTLLARAVAGEAEVPFFSMAASEFIEMVVGVGASRVRDLFEQAKKVAPAIIFIDELDSIGRSRGGSTTMGGHDEREQTLNQILTEMDGFTGNEGVIVIAATNRPKSSTRPSSAPAGSTARWWCHRRTSAGANRSWKCTPATYPSMTTSTWGRSPAPLPAWSGRNCATSSTRRR
jgi:hypothetical protein